jgi:hypothetical protein
VIRGPRPRQARRVHRQLRASTRSTVRPSLCTWPTTCIMRYGTGAIMAVPAEDERDWEFAKVHNGLPYVRTVQPPDWEASTARPWTGEGSQDQFRDFLDGLSVPDGQAPCQRVARGTRASVTQPGQFSAARLAHLTGSATGVVRFRWCTAGPAGSVPVPEERAPRTSLRTTWSSSHRGVAPLARPSEGFLHTTCPICGGPARTRDRHDGHVRGLLLVLPQVLRPVEHRPPFRPRGCGPPLHAGGGSTSEGSSTPSCICSTPASSPVGPDRRRVWPLAWTASRSAGSSSPRA